MLTGHNERTNPHRKLRYLVKTMLLSVMILLDDGSSEHCDLLLLILATAAAAVLVAYSIDGPDFGDPGQIV